MNKRSLCFLALLILAPLPILKAQDALPQDAQKQPAHATDPTPSTPAQPVTPSQASPGSANFEPPADESPVSGQAPAAPDKPNGAPASANPGDSAPASSVTPADPTNSPGNSGATSTQPDDSAPDTTGKPTDPPSSTPGSTAASNQPDDSAPDSTGKPTDPANSAPGSTAASTQPDNSSPDATGKPTGPANSAAGSTATSNDPDAVPPESAVKPTDPNGQTPVANSSDPVGGADLSPAPPSVPKSIKNRISEMGPPKPGEVPIYLKRVKELLSQHDESMAISYLRRIVPNGILSDVDRSQALIELADCLTESSQPGEALTWLRIWVGLFPGRPEAGAVDFRIGCLYEYMHMPREARDTFYLALSATINHGQISDSKDLTQYSCLTTDILWKMAENEYACGQYTRSAQLFERYRKEATAASPLSKEQAEFLEADASYQSHDIAGSTALYEKCIGAHPFNPLVLEARLRLYHLYMLQNMPAKAEEDMKSMAWTVRTVWPQDENYWQKRSLELLLEVNKGNPKLQVPILAAAQRMHVASDLQDELDHYTQLNALQSRDVSVNLQRSTSKRLELNAIRDEETKVDSLSQSIDHLIPAE